jgi:hypothetical protein
LISESCCTEHEISSIFEAGCDQIANVLMSIIGERLPSKRMAA